MTDIVKVTVKMPRIRLFAAKIIITVVAPFVRNQATGQRIGDAVMAWVERGLRLYENGRQV